MFNLLSISINSIILDIINIVISYDIKIIFLFFSKNILFYIFIG